MIPRFYGVDILYSGESSPISTKPWQLPLPPEMHLYRSTNVATVSSLMLALTYSTFSRTEWPGDIPSWTQIVTQRNFFYI